ncbi:MAG: lysophospholipid acyltransferase family protein, partial [Legionellaceae bacterium]|nr:lysophospholipid acyltransferase family protein [Legionellaceae bacterium]
KSLALFVHKKKTPVVPSVAYRRADGTHVLEFFPALEWQHYADANQAIYENTLIYNQALEKMILAHPEQWFWMHRRWKLQDNY